MSNDEEALLPSAEAHHPPRTWPNKFGIAVFVVATLFGIIVVVAALGGDGKEATRMAGSTHSAKTDGVATISSPVENRGLLGCEWVHSQDDCHNTDPTACQCRTAWCQGTGDRGHGKCADAGRNPCPDAVAGGCPGQKRHIKATAGKDRPVQTATHFKAMKGKHLYMLHCEDGHCPSFSGQKNRSIETLERCKEFCAGSYDGLELEMVDLEEQAANALPGKSQSSQNLCRCGTGCNVSQSNDDWESSSLERSKNAAVAVALVPFAVFPAKDRYHTTCAINHVFEITGEWVPQGPVGKGTVEFGHSYGVEVTESTTLMVGAQGGGFAASASYTKSVTMQSSEQTKMSVTALSDKRSYVWQFQWTTKVGWKQIPKTIKSWDDNFAVTSGQAEPPRCWPKACDTQDYQDCHNDGELPNIGGISRFL